MALTALEIKDKTFGVKFRGYDANEVEEFLDIVVRDYEDLVRLNHDQEAKIQALEERLNYFDEMKDSLSQSVLITKILLNVSNKQLTNVLKILFVKLNKMHST